MEFLCVLRADIVNVMFNFHLFFSNISEMPFLIFLQIVENSNPIIKTQAFKVEPEFKSPAVNVLLEIGCYNML
jgi:hypothetical protein